MNRQKGFTLVEVMMAIAISVSLFGSMAAAFLAVKSVNMMARHKIQAVQVVRGQIENLKSTTFASIAGGAQLSSLDAGPDGQFCCPAGQTCVAGQAACPSDDIQGTVTTTVQDQMDFDNDGNTTETLINVDGSGGNDSVAVPVRVSIAWTEHVLGTTKNMSVFADTIIAS